MKTQFALARLEVATPISGPLLFWLDGNGKITRSNGSFANPQPNAFSLVQVIDCPQATSVCKSICYVHRLEQDEREVHEKYWVNHNSLRMALETPADFKAVADAFAAWIQEHCAGGFRWHVSGDIISMRHALFIELVCRGTMKTPFWIYTRSFRFLAPLLRVPNLVVNLSVDTENLQEGLALHAKHGLRLCYLTLGGKLPTLPPGSVIFPSHNLRGRDLERPLESWWWRGLRAEQRRMVCPADYFGQSELIRCGPCRKCLKYAGPYAARGGGGMSYALQDDLGGRTTSYESTD